MFTTRPRLIRGCLVLLAGVVLLSSQGWAASSAATKTVPKKSLTPAKTTVRSAGKKSLRKTSSRRRRYRREPFRSRLARLKLQPERVQEIQQALAQAGYLAREPNGKWDDTTRDAMRRFQEAHGFPSSGLPEAKSLMKLGLGPHPLPEDLDPTAQVRANVSPVSGSSEAAQPAADSPPSIQNQ